jgi:hypothetical protein
MGTIFSDIFRDNPTIKKQLENRHSAISLADLDA